VFQIARTTGNTKIGFDPTNPNSVAANLHVQTNSDRALHVDGPVSGPVYLSAVNNNIGPYDLRELGLRGDPVTIYTGSGAKSNAVARISFPSDAAGITFPATQAASSNANTLDDYEEGDWTPEGLNVTFSVAVGRYNKIGRQVTVWWQVSWPSTANADFARISGLPFTVASDTWSGGLAITDVGIADVLAFVHHSQTNIYHRNSSNVDYSNSQFSEKFSYGCATYIA
jgi:hypothetical protein